MVRAFRPAARAVRVLPPTGRRRLAPVHPGGVFEGELEGAELPLDYELEVDYGDGNTFTVGDPYRFLPTLGDMDLHLAGEGRHEELYAKLGAHVVEHQGVRGTAFAVWAPSARSVSVVGDFNSWDGRLHPMRSLGSSGDLGAVRARRRRGRALQVRDPHPGGRDPAEGRPARAGDRAAAADRVGRPPVGHEWQDEEWMEQRREREQLARRCRSTRSTSARGG